MRHICNHVVVHKNKTGLEKRIGCSLDNTCPKYSNCLFKLSFEPKFYYTTKYDLFVFDTLFSCFDWKGPVINKEHERGVPKCQKFSHYAHYFVEDSRIKKTITCWPLWPHQLAWFKWLSEQDTCMKWIGNDLETLKKCLWNVWGTVESGVNSKLFMLNQWCTVNLGDFGRVSRFLLVCKVFAWFE